MPGSFRTLGIPLLHGRLFSDSDSADAPRVAIVNQALARHHWPEGEAVGQQLHMALHDVTFTIVGVVADVQPIRPDQAPQPAIYWPFAQLPRGAIMLVARTEPRVEGVPATVHARLDGLDPELSIGRMATLDEQMATAVSGPRFNMVLLGLFALVGSTIAAVGIYAVVSFAVAQRRQEIGMRMALGADPTVVLRQVAGQGLRLGAGGALTGLVAALCLSQLLRSLLIRVAPTDPLTLGGAVALVMMISALACYIPARRAARLDPMTALRSE
jgi:hypothetical protein